MCILRSLISILVVISMFACSSEDDPVNCEKEALVINLDGTVNATSCSSNDGSILVSVSGGKEPYTFLINQQEVSDPDVLHSLSAGSYFVEVQDANKCVASLDNIMILAEDFSFNTDILPNTSCLSGNGSVTVNIQSSNPPYSYKLGNGNFIPDNTFTGLASGNHTITVLDNNNCSVNLTVTIPKGMTGTSWTNDIKPILEKKCATSGCHNGVSRSTDFREFSSAKTHAKSIKSKTQDRSMPFDDTLTQNQIDLIGCWVDDGAFQN